MPRSLSRSRQVRVKCVITYHERVRNRGLRVAALAVLMLAAAVLLSALTPAVGSDAARVRHNAASAPLTLTDEEVLVGVYIENIQTITPESNSFTGDFYIWFRWKNPDFKPYETVEFMNLYEAWMLTQLSADESPRRQPDGTLYYAARYSGAFNSPLSLVKFPFGSQNLKIILEDFAAEKSQVRFVADTRSTAMNPDITLPGYEIGVPSIEVSNFEYATDFGDLDEVDGEVYSRATVIIPVSTPGLPNIIKYLLPIVLVVAAASLVFYLPPDAIEGRIVLGITALLTLVAMQWSSTESLPTVAYLTMLDVLYLVGILSILASLILGIRTSWMARSSGEESAIYSDERMLYIFLGAFSLAFAGVLAFYLLR